MKKLLIVSQSASVRTNLTRFLFSCGFEVDAAYESASEVLRAVQYLEEAVIISTYQLRDMMAIDLCESLPNGIDMILVLAQGQMLTRYYGNLVALYHPLSKQELLETLRILGVSDAYRTQEEKQAKEKDVILKAKVHLMAHKHMSEHDAHRYLQKQAMDSGRKIVDVAREVLQADG